MASDSSLGDTPSAQYHEYDPETPNSGVRLVDQGPPAYPGGGAETVAVSVGVEPSPTQTYLTPHRRLSTGSNASTVSSVNENLEVASVTSSIEDRLTWRGRMQVTLHSHKFHFFIIFLVVLDALIVLFELLLDLGAFSNVECEGEGIVEQAEFCHYSASFRDKCGPPAALLLEEINISAAVPRPEDGPAVGDAGLCSCEFSGGKRTCLLEDEGSGVNPALVLHGISLTILSVFMIECLLVSTVFGMVSSLHPTSFLMIFILVMIEISLKWIAFRLKYFLPAIHHIRGHKFYFISFEMFDGMVVVISWILDIASLKEEEAFELFDLIIILRLWRIVRVVNGAVLSAKAQLDQQLHESKHHTRHVITALHKAQDKVDLLERDNQVLRQRLVNQNGNKLPPPPEIRVDTVDGGHTREREE